MPGLAPTMHTRLPASAAVSRAVPLREAQSIAFFSTPVMPPLYSGEASSSASAASMACLSALTAGRIALLFHVLVEQRQIVQVMHGQLDARRRQFGRGMQQARC